MKRGSEKESEINSIRKRREEPKPKDAKIRRRKLINGLKKTVCNVTVIFWMDYVKNQIFPHSIKYKINHREC